MRKVRGGIGGGDESSVELTFDNLADREFVEFVPLIFVRRPDGGFPSFNKNGPDGRRAELMRTDDGNDLLFELE